MVRSAVRSVTALAISGAAVSHRELELEAADGNRFAAFAAEPDEPTGACVVILPDVRGLYRFYEELALRFAERGHRAIAIDYFGRTAGVGKRREDFEYREHVDQTTGSRVPFHHGRRHTVRYSLWLAAARFIGLFERRTA